MPRRRWLSLRRLLCGSLNGSSGHGRLNRLNELCGLQGLQGLQGLDGLCLQRRGLQRLCL